MRINLSRKIWIVAVILCIVTITSGAITYQYIKGVSSSSLRVINVELPIEETFLEMEIGLSQTTRAVLDYVQDYQQKHIFVLEDSQMEFETNVKKFISLCENEAEHLVSNEVALLYSDYALKGYEIIDLQDQQNEKLVELREKVNKIMEEFEEFAGYYAVRTQTSIDDKKNMLVIFRYVKLVAELHTEVEGVLAKHNPSHELNSTYYSDKLYTIQRAYSGSVDSTTERSYLTQIYTDVNDLFQMSEGLMAIAQSLNDKLEDYESAREQIESKLEDQIRKMVNENKEETAIQALSLSQLTLRTTLVDSIIGFVFIGSLLYGINLWIISPVLHLSTGIQQFASGDLDMRINVNSDDEIGDLANAFNDMTIQIEEKIDTITQNEQKLEKLNVDLEKEIQTRKDYEKEMLRVARETEVDRLRSQFLSTITHELRTPLTSIRGYVEIIRSGWVGKVPAEMHETLDIIIRNTDRLSTLTSDLLDVQRIESGRLVVELVSFDLKDVIDQCVTEIGPILSDKKQNLEINLSDTTLTVLGDSQRLSQVVMNLLNNASKFSEEESKILLSAESNDKGVQVSVKDFGIGIKKEDLDRVFEPLAMIEKHIYVKGTGLGLSISKGIIELHKGKIWVESDGEWKGSTFKFQLPRGKHA